MSREKIGFLEVGVVCNMGTLVYIYMIINHENKTMILIIVMIVMIVICFYCYYNMAIITIVMGILFSNYDFWWNMSFERTGWFII